MRNENLIEFIARNAAFDAWQSASAQDKKTAENWEPTEPDYEAIEDMIGELNGAQSVLFTNTYRATLHGLAWHFENGRSSQSCYYLRRLEKGTLVVDNSGEVVDVIADNAGEIDKKRLLTVGTYSHGTMRLQDVLPLELAILAVVAPGHYAQMQCAPFGFPPSHAVEDETAEFWKKESTHWVEEEIIELIDENLPFGYYWGSHPGDGSDVGIWGIDLLD